MMLSNHKEKINPTILIADSGVGGLSIYNEVKKRLPRACYIYLFDNIAFPYGEKPEAFIVKRVLWIINKIWTHHKIDLVILACNTASTIALSILRKTFSCPIIGVVPAIKTAVQLTHNGHIGLLATNATIKSNYTHNLIKKYASHCQILQLGTAELVKITEAKLHGKLVPLSALRNILNPWISAKKPPDTIVLGCTHFPLLKMELQMVLKKGTILVDSGSAIARRACWLAAHNIDYETSNLQSRRVNKAYCLTITPDVLDLIPTLIYYGFNSLEEL
ncbi:glutamate racemase [secondary endosymbiont of Heteropsylla cubana]|uniref:Glutamate racemase n=2 Tax=secondary endosymbiont of Heteropsylla cubana TaxID=134287 RepID=J3Z567_9ENTR|nr:glutamate racemase [secondary endosymbiont of Heteropsylla cubana]AFP85454.1 glutamate racemase [secondary endosymbiont of Heteropsylla cubana]